MGMSRIRRLLYMCAWSAIKFNASCRSLYERLVEKGKAKMVAPVLPRIQEWRFTAPILFLLCLAALVSQGYAPFVYFQF